MLRVAINGLGRIGRLALRRLAATPGIQVVALNDPADAPTLAHLLTYDSVHGRAAAPAVADGRALVVDGHRIPLHAGADPSGFPFAADGAQLVIDCTSRCADRNRATGHLQGSVAHVILAGPSPEADFTVVPGLNEAGLDLSSHRILSAACATSHALALVAQVLDDAFGLEQGLVTTVHSYDGDQRILDLPHPDLRRARAAAANMIPAPLDAMHTVGRILPRLAGRLEGLEVRVPTPDVSLLDLTAQLQREAGLDAVHAAFRRAAEGPLGRVLEVLEDELVSVDLVGRTASALYDPSLTKALAPRLVKVFAWYDHEAAYAARLEDLCLHVLERTAP